MMRLIGIVIGLTTVFVLGIITNELGHRLDKKEGEHRGK